MLLVPSRCFPSPLHHFGTNGPLLLGKGSLTFNWPVLLSLKSQTKFQRLKHKLGWNKTLELVCSCPKWLHCNLLIGFWLYRPKWQLCLELLAGEISVYVKILSTVLDLIIPWNGSRVLLRSVASRKSVFWFVIIDWRKRENSLIKSKKINCMSKFCLNR